MMTPTTEYLPLLHKVCQHLGINRNSLNFNKEKSTFNLERDLIYL